MFLFKACPRCRGDIDMADPDDVYCVQCGHRPTAAVPCPKCGSRQSVQLAQASQPGNTRYCCARCGRIFTARGWRRGALP